ncbi:MAG TPA: ABC transporter substrate-binding protein, partial [Stellaceae bacterium]|nr:ABC transporter substrate-binding protein [Stellaceae bacterium]
MLNRRHFIATAAAAAMLGAARRVRAARYSGPGISDNEIRIGNTMAYSGNSAPYGSTGIAESAYFDMINAQGGVNGRKIKFLTRDDALTAAKTVELTRQLVEQDDVLAMFSILGSATNHSVRAYLNQRQVPQLFCASAAGIWGDYQHFPWTIGWAPSYFIEEHGFVAEIRRERPNGKIAILHENTDLGRDAMAGLRDALGADYDKMVIADTTYDPPDPTVDSQIVSLYGSGADIFINISTAKFAAMAIRKVYEIGWRPLHFLTATSNSVGAVIRPAGVVRATGIVSTSFLKDPTDPQWQDDPGVTAWRAWMAAYNRNASTADISTVGGYSQAQTLVEVLRRCGDD